MDQPRRCFLSGRVLLGLPVRVAVFRFRRHGDLFRTFFEHLDAETEARAFLLECLRCLQSQGVMRLVVPDAGAYLRAYSGPWEVLAEMRPLARMADGWRDNRLGWIYQTKMQFMNAIFRQRAEHKYAYDAETLVLALRQAGFVDVVVQQFGVSIDPKMAPDSDDRRTESLYVEGVKR